MYVIVMEVVKCTTLKVFGQINRISVNEVMIHRHRVAAVGSGG